MKCDHCGAELGLLDKVCPYCGSVNTQSGEHQREQEDYEKRSRKMTESLRGHIAENVPLVCSAILLFLLLTGILTAGYLGEKAYDLVNRVNAQKAADHYEENMQKILQYLDDKDYIGCLAFVQEHDLKYCAAYDELWRVWDLCGYYENAVNAVEELAIHGTDTKRLMAEDDIAFRKVDIATFYEAYGFLTEGQQDGYQKYMDGMKEQVDVILRIYLGLDEEKREKYLAGSENEQAAYLEEVLIDE